MNLSSTPFPVPTFHGSGDDASPEQFLKFLQNLISEYLGGDSTTRISSNNKDTWVTIITGLTDHFLVSFPLPDSVSWTMMREKMIMMETTFEVIQRVFNCVEGIYNGSEVLVKNIFARLLSLCRVLDVWVDAGSIECEDMITPTLMTEKALRVLVSVLRGLGGNITTTEAEPSWKTLRLVLIECLDVCHDMTASSFPNSTQITVALFSKPRFVEARQEDIFDVEPVDNPSHIVVQNISHIPAFLALILDITVKALCPSLLCEWFLTDLTRRAAEAARSIFDFISTPQCIISSGVRAKTLMKIVASVIPLHGIRTARGPIFDLQDRLVRQRLDAGLKQGWEDIDADIMKILETNSMVSLSKGNATQILKTLRIDNGGVAENQLRTLATTYLRSWIKHADHDTLRSIKDELLFLNIATQQSIDDHLGTRAIAAETLESHTFMDPVIWRARLHEAVVGVVGSDNVDWMDDDEESDLLRFASRAVASIQDQSEKPLSSASAQGRLAVADRLVEFPCLLALCDGKHCQNSNKKSLKSAWGPCLPIFSRLLDGPEDEVTSEVRQRVFTALSRMFMHHDLESILGSLDYATLTIFHGITSTDRYVRLSAGRALVGLVHLYASNERYREAEAICAQMASLMDTAKNPVRETLITTIGSMGRMSNEELQGQILQLLIAQLSRPNPVVKGSTFMQILAIAKYYKKTPYSLILPYMDQIAPFIVSRMCTQPSILHESCRLLSISPSDFISVTLPRTLPRLFADCEQKVLETIARETGTKPSSLLIKHSHEILAFVFLLPGAGSTTKALNFILKILTDATHSTSIDIQSVVKSCVVPLLAELVIVMGDEKPEISEGAITALKRVEQVLGVAPGKGRGHIKAGLGAFLKTYMLGLISDINEMLQDVQGKKSVISKRKILRSLGALIHQIGPAISHVAPQIMATFQTMVSIPELSEVTLDSWHIFLTTLGPQEAGPHVGPTSAAFVSSWHTFSPGGRALASKSLDYIILEIGNSLGRYLDDVVDISSIDELRRGHRRLKILRVNWTPKDELQRILERSSSDNLTVAVQSLRELKNFMSESHKDFVRELASGDMFDPMVGQILAALFAAACRDGESTDTLKLLAFDCIAVLGAVDPDRCEIAFNDPGMVVLHNYMDEGEAVAFALHLIGSLLVGAFRSTSDIKYQSHLAYSIQELLKFCQFTPALVAAGSASVPVKVRNRWNSLPKHVLETVTPLLEARFTLNLTSTPEPQHPIYPNHSTYREWIQLWTTHLISQASGPMAQTIFGVFRSAVRNKDVVVAHHLLPHLVLNILISGGDDDSQAIRSELLVVLEDQVNNDSSSTSDKKLLSAQAVFMLLDHLNKWVRIVRQDISTKKAETKRSRSNQVGSQLEEQLLRVDSILSSIDYNLMARAAFQCKAFARSLMNFERHIMALQEQSAQNPDLPEYYERLHEIYAHLDEPDGMEGVSSLILSPSLEHQIRQHENTGRWTAAQSCWEVRLQQAPDNVEFHLGLMRCLRNLGHYDTLRTHVRGVLTRHPGWEAVLAGFQVESAWMVGDWDDVESLVQRIETPTSQIVMARLLLAMRTGDSQSISDAISMARSVLGAPITAAGVKGYRRAYDAVLDLHLTRELEIIQSSINNLPMESQGNTQKKRHILAELSKMLSGRLDATLPTFRSREPILSMRRTAFALSATPPRQAIISEIGLSWLASAKIARKAGQWQTAYSAMLQAKQSKSPFSFMETAKLVKATGEPLRALQELENSMKLLGLLDEESVVDLTIDKETQKMRAKAQVLRARWMNESDRFEMNPIYSTFSIATNLQPGWESAHFYLGQFHDECFKGLPHADQINRGMKMNLYTVRSFAKAIKFGSKYVYQTVPRLLTIWLDLGEDRGIAGGEVFKKLNELVARAITDTPVYKWYTAFPQIVSRVGHSNPEVYKHLSRLIVKVMEEYPKQALWLFTSVVKSTKANRGSRGKQLLEQLANNPTPARNQVQRLIKQSIAMTNELLALCDHHIDESKSLLSMNKDFPQLAALGHSDLIIPLQESLTATLPPTSSSESLHQPFPLNVPTFEEFSDEVEIMRSLAKPRKITIRGSDGQIYMFLGKPKDDLRKDARLMDFNAIINKLLKANSESRRRQLHIRTYGVVTLNEECGFIQWVPNTIPIRPVLVKSYDARRIKNWSGEMNDAFRKIKDAPDKSASETFRQKILPMFPPVFHEWFLETFPEPTAWLASRLTYGRTAAVMSMVGFILGLGDRHCENILLDTNTGDVVHVDFNCLFEKGKTLETPERVPFRLTQNLVDGLGVTGVEGVFRLACEVTMQLLRDNKDSLMSVLDAFIHDPLVEWEDEKRKLEREPTRSRNQVKPSVDLRMLAKGALSPIERKLKGIYSTSKERQEKEISTSNLVQMLIQEATDTGHLAKMYPGWAPWH